MMTYFSRRVFLKTMGLSVLGLGAASVLAGCRPGSVAAALPGEVQAEKGTSYMMGNWQVGLADITGPSGSAKWETDYISATKAFLKDEDAYDDASEEIKARVKASAIASANSSAAFGDWVVALSFQVENFTSSDAVLTTSAAVGSGFSKDSKTNTKVVTAEADGKSLVCVLDNSAVAANTKETVVCRIAAPVNFETMTVSVKMPGVGKTLKYTVENKDHVDVDRVDIY